MYFRITGNCFSENIVKEIAAITNHGILHLNKVYYDEKEKIVSIAIERCKIKTIKKIFLGTTLSYKYDKNNKIPSLIVIRKVENCKIENIFQDPNITTIHILFGLSVNMEQKEISIGSVEEQRGETCFSLKIKVSDIDVEINDQAK